MRQLRVPRTIRVRIWAEYDVYTSKRDVQKLNYTKETENMCQLHVPRTIHTILVREQNVTYTRHKQTYNHRPTHRWVLSKTKNVKSIAFYLCHIFSWVGSSAECAAHIHPKTLFEIAMALFTISVSFPSDFRKCRAHESWAHGFSWVHISFQIYRSLFIHVWRYGVMHTFSKVSSTEFFRNRSLVRFSGLFSDI